MSLILLKNNTKVYPLWKQSIFIGGPNVKLMPEVPSESNSESNKKILQAL
jgi:hypothetical protein